MPSGGRLNIKMSSYQYKDPHVKDKTVSQPSFFNMGIPIPGKDGLYIKTGLWLPWQPLTIKVLLSSYERNQEPNI